MDMTGHTILITGGGSGIGRGLAEAFHGLGNTVIIAGRRQAALDAVAAENPGMIAETLDIADTDDITRFARAIVERHPDLDMVINNAGIMVNEDVLAGQDHISTAERTIATNLLGPIRLNALLLDHLRHKSRATLMMVSSGLAFVPLAATPTYSATKAAIHSYSVALRHQLRETAIDVVEIAPPYVRTGLQGEHQATDPNAMPLEDFIAETMRLLAEGPQGGEVLVERVHPLRFAVENGAFDRVFAGLNQS